MLWTDGQSIENETIGSKEYMHDLRERCFRFFSPESFAILFE